MAEVVELPVITRLAIPPDRILKNAIGKLERCVVIGITTDGDEFFASSDPDGGTILWDMERAKLKLLRVPDEFEGR